jgi:hypothetical protein
MAAGERLRRRWLRRLLGTGIGALVLAGVALTAPTVGGQAPPPLPAEKQAILDRYAGLQAQGVARPAPVAGAAANPYGDPPPVPAARPGIVAGVGRLNGETETMGPPGIAGRFTNSWYVVGPPLTAIVWAGADRDDTGQGILVVSVWTDAQATSLASLKVLLAPGRTGQLRIAAASGYGLVLVGRDGSRLGFDLGSMTFQK